MQKFKIVQPSGDWCECCGCTYSDKEIEYVREEDMFLCAQCEHIRSTDHATERSWEIEQMQAPY